MQQVEGVLQKSREHVETATKFGLNTNLITK